MRSNHPRRAACVAATLLVLLAHAPVAPAAAWEAPLSVRRGAAVPAPGFPVTTGVPLPPGRLAAGDAVALRPDAPSGVQGEPLEHWPDGSVRWLLVDFVTPPAGAGSSTVAVVPAAAAERRTAMPVERTPDGVTVDAGSLRAQVARDGTIRLPSSGGAAAVVLRPRVLTLAGQPAAPPIPDDLTVETHGPVRTEILLTGRYPGGVAYEERVALFAGQPYLRVRHTLVNRGADPEARIAALAAPVELAARTGALAVDGRIVRFERLGAEPQVVHQRDADTLHGTVDGRRSDGLATAAGELLTAAVLVPDLWQQYPKRLAVAERGIHLDLWAGGERPVGLGIGAAKTHEYWVAVHPTGRAPSPAALRSLVLAPPVALPQPRWTAESDALAGALHAGAPGAADFLDRLQRDVGRYQARARFERWDAGPPGPCSTRTTSEVHTGFYGLLHFGDWNFPGFHDELEECDAWGNLEYDLAQVLGLAAVSTGRADLFRAFERAAVHYRDVDVIHADPAHPERIGLNHPHKVGHFDRRARGNVDLGHAWLEGLLTHHRLTGQRRSRDAALRMADALAGRLHKAGNARQFGWPMVALAAAATSTGSARLRTAALEFARGGMRRFPPTAEGIDWKIGVLAEGLMAVHALTHDAEIEQWLRRYGERLLAAAPDTERDPRPGVVLGYLAALTGDERYRRAALAQVEATEIGTWGKPIAIRGRVGFRMLAPPSATRPADDG